MAGNRIGIEAIYNSVPPSPADGQAAAAQVGSRGSLKMQLHMGDSASLITSAAYSGDANASPNALAVASHPLGWTGASWDRIRTPLVFASILNVAVTAGTPVSVWTPAAGKKFRLMGYALSMSAGGNIIFKVAGVVFLRLPGSAGQASVINPQLGNGLLAALANDVLQIDVSTTGNVSGYVYGVEE